MSSLCCWMHHDRQGCLSKEIIPQPRVRFLLVKFLQVSQKVGSPFFLTDAQLQQSGFYLLRHLEQQVSSLRTGSNARHECFGCPRSYLSLSLPSRYLTDFLFLQALWCSKVSKQVIALHWINGRGSTQLLQPLNLRGKLRLHSATALPPVTASPTWHPSDLLYSNGSAGSGSGWFRV